MEFKKGLKDDQKNISDHCVSNDAIFAHGLSDGSGHRQGYYVYRRGRRAGFGKTIAALHHRNLNDGDGIHGPSVA